MNHCACLHSFYVCVCSCWCEPEVRCTSCCVQPCSDLSVFFPSIFPIETRVFVSNMASYTQLLLIAPAFGHGNRHSMSRQTLSTFISPHPLIGSLSLSFPTSLLFLPCRGLPYFTPASYITAPAPHTHTHTPPPPLLQDGRLRYR